MVRELEHSALRLSHIRRVEAVGAFLRGEGVEDLADAVPNRSDAALDDLGMGRERAMCRKHRGRQAVANLETVADRMDARRRSPSALSVDLASSMQ